MRGNSQASGSRNSETERLTQRRDNTETYHAEEDKKTEVRGRDITKKTGKVRMPLKERQHRVSGIVDNASRDRGRDSMHSRKIIQRKT
jgi:hypothetical protein